LLAAQQIIRNASFFHVDGRRKIPAAAALSAALAASRGLHSNSRVD
jgi:hypothetical protein